MNHRMQFASFADRFEHLLKIIGSQRFLDREGIGNEVPFFIVPFKVAETNDMEQLRKQLINKLKHQGTQVLDINLYDLVHGMLDNESGDWEYCIQEETNQTKDELLEYLQGVADAPKVVAAISEKMESANFDVMFISGVGEVYPFIRSHNILNNLQKTAKDKPTVMFFPGEYTHSLEKGASLDLFGRLNDDKYYRAFNIYDRET